MENICRISYKLYDEGIWCSITFLDALDVLFVSIIIHKFSKGHGTPQS